MSKILFQSPAGGVLNGADMATKWQMKYLVEQGFEVGYIYCDKHGMTDGFKQFLSDYQINDYFFIQGEEGTIVKTLVIYDRWGEKIFETSDKPINSPSSGWDGTFHSKELTPGVFVYYAMVLTKGVYTEIFGEITLLK